MIQLLVSLIEWFAVMGLSLLGITLSPGSDCVTVEPTEYRQMIVWTPADTHDARKGTQISSRDCLSGAEILIHEATPAFVTPSDRYDS